MGTLDERRFHDLESIKFTDRREGKIGEGEKGGEELSAKSSAHGASQHLNY